MELAIPKCTWHDKEVGIHFSHIHHINMDDLTMGDTCDSLTVIIGELEVPVTEFIMYTRLRQPFSPN